ncbi:MAG: cation-efflux pump, partial [Tissierellales bacterium]
LLGPSPDPELIDKIKKLILADDNIKGLHDLVVHDYGPNKIMASVHAEVSSKANIVHIHSIIDGIEKKIKKELNVDIVIHMDPIESHERDEQKRN